MKNTQKDKTDCGGGIRVIGLTGGTGSGKSEAARRLDELGFPTINADTIGHELLLPGGEAEADVINAFGPGITTDNHIDRSKLGARVFSDPEARRILNNIVHPRIKKEIKRRIHSLAQKGYKTVIVDAALIAESGEREPCLDSLILVTCPEEVRVQRLMKARNLTSEEALQRVRSQTPPETKLALADWVLDNKGELEGFLKRVERLAAELRAYED